MQQVNNVLSHRSVVRGCVVASLIFWITIAEVAAQERVVLPVGAGSAPHVEAKHGEKCRIVYLGFVGAFESAQSRFSGVVQIRNLLRGPQFAEVCAKTYAPYQWAEGRDWILSQVAMHEGMQGAGELGDPPKVVLVGHSMGGWAAMTVARELKARGIPVELTVQVDSVGISDVTVPSNVKLAAIFHANDVLMPLTTKKLKLEDPSQTRVVANVRVEHAGHWSITRDRRIRELVVRTVGELRETSAGYPCVR